MKRYIILLFILIPNILFSQRLVQQESKLGTDSLKAKYYFFEALRNKYQQNFEISYELLNRCIAIDKHNPDFYYELSIVSFNLNKKEEALKYAQAAYVSDTTNKYYAMQYAQVLSLMGKNLESAWIYKKIVNSNSATIEDYLNLTYLYQRIGDFNSALAIIDKAESLYGTQDIISSLKIEILTNLKRFGKAIIEAKQLVNIDSTNIRSKLVLYDTYLAANDIASAEHVLANCYQIDSTNTLVLLNLSNFYLVTGHTDLYFQYLHKLISANGNLEDIYQLIAKILSNGPFASQFISDINSVIGQLKSKFGIVPLVSEVQSQVDILTGNYVSAINNLSNVVHSRWSSESIWERYLSLELQLQQHDSINAITDSLISVFTDNPFIPFIKAISLWQQKRGREAIKILKLYQGRLSNRPALAPDYLSTMGDIYHELGEERNAFDVYDKVLALDPKNLPVLNNYSYFLSLKNNRLEEALKMSRITVDNDPNNATYLDTYGWILFKLKRYIEAQVYLRQAIVNGGDNNAEVLEHYGDVLYRLDKVSDAVTYWNMSLQLDPSRKDLKEKINKKRL